MDEGRKWDLGRRTEKISTREHNVPTENSVPPASFRRMGMWLLLASLGMLLSISALLAVAFLVAQISNWMRMAASSVLPNENLLVWFFYALTILHAAHVLFGLIPLLLVTARARRGRYTVDEHESVHLVGMYWHFLLVTWIAILVVLRF
jgi:heme/copper-type cytochrome/quinol oxidase subunit 3